jgi:hypothetical protein
MAEEPNWHGRLLAYTGVRAFGLAVMMLGFAVFYSDLLAPGGSPRVGAILIVMGAIDALFAPRLLRKYWDEKDRGSL